MTAAGASSPLAGESVAVLDPRRQLLCCEPHEHAARKRTRIRLTAQTEEVLVTYVEYLINNIYVNIGNRIYRQCVGIPMGTDCAPLLANLFLFFL